MPRKRITQRPEERADTRVGLQNKFVYRRVHELVEKLPKYYRSLHLEHFPNTRVQRTTTTCVYIYVNIYVCVSVSVSLFVH